MMKTCLVVIALAILFCTNPVFSQDLKKEISAADEGTIRMPIRLNAGFTLPVKFDGFSLTGVISIGGQTFEVSAPNGTLKGEPFTVTLEPGTHTLTETYTGEVSLNVNLILISIRRTIEIPEIVFTRTISVDKETTYIITMDTVASDLTMNVDGDFEGEINIPGPIAGTFDLTLVNPAAIIPGEIAYTASFKAEILSSTTIEGDTVNESPTLVSVEVGVVGGGVPLTSSQLIAVATASDPEDTNGQPTLPESAFSYQWMEDGVLIVGATDKTLSAPLKKGSRYSVQVIATDSDGTQSPPMESDAIVVLSAILGDVNGDDIVNIFDLVIVSQNFGQTPPTNPAADVNGDSIVNIFDLVIVSSNFGQTADSTATPAGAP